MNRHRILGFAVGPIGAGLLSVISLPIMTWLFPPDMIGKLSMLQVATSLFTVLCCFGLDQAYVREFHESKDKPKLFMNTMMPGLIFMLVLLFILLIFSPSLISNLLFDERDTVYSLSVGLCLVSVYLSRFLSLILRMQDRGLAFSMSQLFSKLILFLIILSYLTLSPPYTFNMLLAAQVCAFVVTLFVFAWNTRYDWLPAFKAQLDYTQFSYLFRFGGPLVFAGLASWGLSTIDRVFLRSMSTYEELAVYSVAASIASAITIFSGVFNIIWAPMVFRWVNHSVDMGRVDEIAKQVTVIVFLLVCLAGGGSWILYYFLPPIYENVQYVVVGCVVSPLLYTLSEVTGVGIAVSRKTIYSFFASFGAVVLDIGLCFFLVPKYGATGAMIASVIAFGLFFVLRTEFSVVLWRDINRKTNYIYMGVIIFLAVVFSLYGHRFHGYAVILWWVIFVFFAFFNRSTLLLFWRSVKT